MLEGWCARPRPGVPRWREKTGTGTNTQVPRDPLEEVQMTKREAPRAVGSGPDVPLNDMMPTCDICGSVVIEANWPTAHVDVDSDGAPIPYRRVVRTSPVPHLSPCGHDATFSTPQSVNFR